ncbi:acyl-CoA synthetase short-chain family member 3, mitochondrial-like [Frankliniella occidentalis]|uniref:Acyl-CoA synthetase short-chain family member 3, mitochondrial n=1 Tax=Frankliniella occidentalis TaxID=133901 RepID=A0A9C6WXG7_FRAOC|nr:acyl-CoA synthetase short-chain family member 3, mitochondrial-like [Frankliniella occidentalis]
MINGDLTEQQPGIQPGLQPASRVGSKGNGVILSHFRDDHLHEEDLVMKQSRFYSPKYEETFRRSLEDREAFWSEVAETVSWTKRWEKVVDDSNQPFTKWFVGGELNACYNAVDRHVEAGRKDKVALIHASPVTNTTRKVTYGELQDQVSRLAGGLAALGVSKGDRVLIYMPLIPETIIAMLATVRLGAVHSVVFGGENTWEVLLFLYCRYYPTGW